MTLVVDASTVVSAFTDGGSEGEWAIQLLESDQLAAPHLMPAEAASVLRRLELSGNISQDDAVMAYAEMQALQVQFFPYEEFADRVWELRHSVTSYDAWYVAVAEWLDLPLVTLDRRLARASGPRCRFLIPPI